MEVYAEAEPFVPSENVDAQLYNGFFSDADRAAMKIVLETEPRNLPRDRTAIQRHVFIQDIDIQTVIVADDSAEQVQHIFAGGRFIERNAHRAVNIAAQVNLQGFGTRQHRGFIRHFDAQGVEVVGMAQLQPFLLQAIGQNVGQTMNAASDTFQTRRGTYTPFLLVGLNSPLAKGLMIVIWSLALLGILFKLTIAHRFKILSLVTYLTMGWLSLIVVYQLAVKLAVGGVTLLAVGGVVYSLGVIFYVCKRIPYNHAIWHGFVLGGSVCHFLAIYLYIGQS